MATDQQDRATKGQDRSWFLLLKGNWFDIMHTETKCWPAKKELLKLLPNFLRPPDQHFKVARKMQQRLCIGQIDSGRLRHGIQVKFSFGILQLPWQVMDISPQNVALIDGIK